MSLEIGPDLSPTFSFDRETSSGEKLITFKDNLNPRTDFDQLSKLLATLLDEEEKKCMADLKQYLVKNEVSFQLALFQHLSLSLLSPLILPLCTTRKRGYWIRSYSTLLEPSLKTAPWTKW